MPGTAPLVRLFVSSTFLDFQAERNVLHTRVFPRVRALCAAHGLRFQPIDLRWGISDAAAAGQLTLPLCLEEIARCQRSGRRPNFLALVGDRYGWQPLPAAISVAEADLVFGAIEDAGEASLAREWYRRDDNARPAEYRLRAREGEWRDAERWQTIETALTATLRAAARRVGLDGGALFKYEASATEQEIGRAVLGAGADPAGALCVVRQRVDAGTAAGAGDDAARDAVRLRALTDALTRACGDRVWRYDVAPTDAGGAAYLDRFADDMIAGLERAVLDGGAGEEDLPPGPVREAEAHAAFAAERRAGFVGRHQEIGALLEKVDTGPPRPVLVVGPSGSGKSALMARLDEVLRARGVRVLARFAGASPICNTWRGLLASLAGELRGAPSERAPSDAPSHGGEPLDEVLARVLRAWPSDQRLVLLIDGADQLGGAGTSPHLDDVLAWLPRPLPAAVRVVVSVAADRAAPLAALLPDASRVEIGGLPWADAGPLLEAWLAEGGRTIQPTQRAAVLAAPESGLPLYLRLAADACARWASDTPPAPLAPDLTGLVRQRLEHLVAPEMHGEMFVARALGYLASSRSGLTEDELLDLLSSDAAVHAELRRTAHHELPDGRVPVVLWARLYQDLLATLSQRLVDGDSVLAFYHRQIEEGVRSRFVAGGDERGLHARLADHFRASPGARALAERPYQEASAGQWGAFRDTLSSVEYLIARVRAHGAAPAIDDFGLGALALTEGGPGAAMPEETARDAEALERVRRSLELSAHAIERDPVQIRTHLLARLAEAPVGPIARLRRESEAGGPSAWVAPLRVSLASADSPLVRSMTGHAGSLVAMATDATGQALVTGDDQGRLQVWNARSGTLRRSFGHADGKALRWLHAGPDLRAVAAGTFDGQAYLWDAEAGVLLADLPKTWPPLATSLDGRLLALSPAEGGLVVWDLGVGRADPVRHWPELHFVRGCFGRDGAACIVADREGNVLALPVTAHDGVGHDVRPGGSTAGEEAPSRPAESPVIGATKMWSAGRRTWRAGSTIETLHPGADPHTIVLTLALPQREEHRYTGQHELRLAVLDLATGAVTWRTRKCSTAWCSADGSRALIGRRRRARRKKATTGVPPGPTPSELVAVDLRTGEEIWKRKDDLIETRILTWAPDGNHVLALQIEFPEIHYGMPVPHRIGWIDLASGEPAGPLLLDVEAIPRVPHVVAGDAGRFGAWCVFDDTVRFTSPGGSPLPPLTTPGARVVAVSAVENGRYLATASADGVIRIWNPTAQAGASGTITGAPIRAVARTGNGAVVVVRASAIEHLMVETWATQSARTAAIPMLTSEIGLAAVSAGGGWVAYLEQATMGISHQEMYLWPLEMLVVWNVADRAQLDSFPTKLAGGDQLNCTHLAVADHGRRVALGVASRESTWAVALWEPESREERRDVETRAVALGALAITPDGSRMASGWDDGEIVVTDLDPGLWRTQPNRLHRSRARGSAAVRALAWGPDADRLAWACEDDTISVSTLAPESGGLEAPRLFRGEAGRLVFSRDGTYLLAIGAELAWHRMPTGDVVARLALDASFVDAALLDAGRVVAGDKLGGLHLLELRAPAPDGSTAPAC